VDTTGITIENYDLPQTEKLHHNNVLSKPGYKSVITQLPNNLTKESQKS
jgi:hypothetical protein